MSKNISKSISFVAAVISGNPKFVQHMLENDTEVCCSPKKFTKLEDDSLGSFSVEVSQETTKDKLLVVIEELEFSGAACILYGDKKTRHYAFICRANAMELQQSNVFRPISKNVLSLTLSKNWSLKGRKNSRQLVNLTLWKNQRRKSRNYTKNPEEVNLLEESIEKQIEDNQQLLPTCLLPSRLLFSSKNYLIMDLDVKNG